MAEREYVRCRTCGRLVFWVTTTKTGSRIALEPLPKPFEDPPAKAPNVILEADGRARVLTKVEQGDDTLNPRYLAHWANCADARRAKDLKAARARVDERRAERFAAEDAELEQLRGQQRDELEKGCD